MHSLYQEILFTPSPKLKILAPKATYTIKNHIILRLQSPIKTYSIKWEVEKMVSIEDIPAEQRWEIAARAASAIPFAYDIAFREAIGEKYDEIERPIYIEAGKEFRNLASALGLPTGNAREISETFEVIGTILNGPEFKAETTEEGDDRTVGKTTQCPILNRAVEMGLDPQIVALTACQTYHKSAIENLNPGFTHHFNKTMCSGDPYCESVIERRK
jgi:predicted ArsR family transcriptional regulator